jgi:hypothetical protein
MSDEDPFRPLLLNNKYVFWYTVTGYAKGIRRFTRTMTLPGTEHTPKATYQQQVTEFWIKDHTGKETPVVLPWDLMLDEGQHVTAVHSGIEDNPKSAWLILVNHDAASSHYLESPRDFLHNAGVIYLVPRWTIFVLVVAGLIAFLFSGHISLGLDGLPITTGPTASLLTWVVLYLAPALLLGLVLIWQSVRVRRLWTEVEAAVPGMVDTILATGGEIDWSEPPVDEPPAES